MVDEKIINKETLLEKFAAVYGDNKDAKVFFAPGRVNLIGEHTDYNGGHVFPCALTIGTYVVMRKTQDNSTSYYSMNFSQFGVIKGKITQIRNTRSTGWANYPKGVVWAFQQKHIIIGCGFEMLVYGNIPNGSGLSSSASLEVATAYALTKLYNIPMDNVQIAKICQYAENEFNKVNCGIMDQFAIAMGKKEHAIYLDTANLKYQYVPVKLEGISVVITSSNKKRGLGESKYNERRSECEEAYSYLEDAAKKAGIQINSLGDLTSEQFEQFKEAIPDEILRKRAKHAVYENERTIRAVKALNQNDIEQFGHLMNESHISLQYDYEVTGIELDTLVEAAWECKGVIGSRMTGAGFGGCTVSLVKNENVSDFMEYVKKVYSEKVELEADFYIVEIGNGPHRL